ncbi:MAG: DUF503 domain-containing protein [bacterium]|nr:DUF503 domain-containing protein [bacterium]
MVIGSCYIDIRIRDSNSLKDKRKILISLKSIMRQKFNISITELNPTNNWCKATLGIACINDSKQIAYKILSKIVDFIHSNPKVDIIDYAIEMY